MTYRSRINYTPEQKKEMWDRWQKGYSLKDNRQTIEHFRSLAPAQKQFLGIHI